MGLRGPAPKSAEVRVFEGERAHRPLPATRARHAVGVPDRPKGMTAAARRIWDGYVGQLAGTLRQVDGFALRRLCEDVALLEELQAGMRAMAADMKRQAKADSDRLGEVERRIAAGESLEAARVELLGRRLSGGAMTHLASTHEGRRITSTISSLASRIQRQELQFGLTPVSAARLEESGGLSGGGLPVGGSEGSIEARLCG